jgi:DNA processing protein
LLQLSLIDGVGPRTVFSLLSSMMGIAGLDFSVNKQQLQSLDLQLLYQYNIADFLRHAVSMKMAQKMVDGLAESDQVEKIFVEMEKHQIRWVSLFDAEYPALLQQIHTPPLGFYIKGAQLADTPLHLGIVGSRMAGAYAQHVIDRVVAPLVASGAVLVSGGALGVDSMAHRLSVQYQKPTVVLLGSGLLSLYPRQNISLFDQVLATGGSLISSFSLQTGPDRFNFPVRNRIIAGMSHAVLVVQAAAKSGALITAEYALQEGRNVMAIPGAIDDPLSAGCHALLKQGATLITSYDDLCFEIGFEQQKDNAVFVQTEQQETLFYPAKEEQDPLLKTLVSPHHLESLAFKLDVSMDELEDRLFTLQLDGMVTQRIDGSWVSL